MDHNYSKGFAGKMKIHPAFAFFLFLGINWTSELSGQQITQVYDTAGIYTFVAPLCVTSIQVQCWGGGGGGGGGVSNPANDAGGGGGGGGYTLAATVAVTPGNSYSVTVGAGGTAGTGLAGGNGGTSSFNGTVNAAGGTGGGIYDNFFSSGNGAGGAYGTGGTYNGGNGANGDHPNCGGGGGGGAGSGGNGGNGGGISSCTGGAGGTGTQPGGAGGAGADQATGSPGIGPGGGGGGAFTANLITGTPESGGVGGPGQVIITYTAPPLPTITNVTGPGCIGSTITITGTNLSGASSVTINASAITNLNVASTVITGKIAPGNTTGLVMVTTSCGSVTDPTPFTINAALPPVNLGTQTICPGSSYIFGGNLYSIPGNYADTSSSTVSGCDSITTITLALGTITPQIVNQSICTGVSYTFNGTSYSNPGVYSDTLPGAGMNGCDSIVTLNLAVRAGFSSLSVSAFNTSCGIDNGSAIAVVSPDTGSFIYIWNTLATTDTITGIGAGTYSVTVTDTSGCSGSASAVIVSSSTDSVTITQDKNIMCSGDTAHLCAVQVFAHYLWNIGDTTACIATTLGDTSNVTVTDNGGCTAVSNWDTVAIYPQTAIVLTVSNDTLRAYGGLSYQWYYGDSITTLPDDTSAVLVADRTGKYFVSETDTNGCFVLSTGQNITVSGIELVSSMGSIAVYPNPLQSGNLYLEAGVEWMGSLCELHDAAGKLIYKTVISNQKSEILFNAAPGIYLMRIYSAQRNYSFKLVKL